MSGEYEVEILEGSDGLDAEDDNVDVEVAFADGSLWFASFFTPRNVATLLERWAQTGEYGGGHYFRTSGAIIVPRLDRETIEAAVESLRAEGDFEGAFIRRWPSPS